MPVMVRISKEATKIAYQIMGQPANMAEPKKKPKEVAKDKQLLFEETIRLR